MQDTPYKIYNASAGSGKTYTLAKEYLKIVLSSRSHKSYGQILAITFTNKAVNEMKQRILGSLFNFGRTTQLENASPMFLSISKELQIDAKTLQLRAKKTLKEILHNYAFFDVSTIDKFTHRLIRTFAKDLKLPKNFEVILDTDLLLDEAVAKLINKAGTDKQLTKVLVDFALEKIDDDKSWDVTIDLNKMGGLLFDENHIKPLKKLEGKSIDDFLKLKDILQKRTISIERTILSSATEILQNIANNGVEFSDFNRSYFPKFILKIEQGDLHIDFKAAWKQNFESEPLYNKSCPEETKTVLDNLHPKLIYLFNKIKANYYELSFLKNCYKNIVPLTVLNAIQQEVKNLEQERDQLPISSFNGIISNEIRDQPAPFIYERLGEKYRHYFVDEFQDTSEMQWNNLIPLIGNALEGEDDQGKKGSLLLVGDAKQAIYRWRGGKAEQFLNLINLNVNPFVVPPKIENLPANFRSHEEIIKFNNDFFTTTSPFLNKDIYNQLFVEGNQQETNTKKGGLVQFTFIEEKDSKDIDKLYCSHVLKTIQEVLAKNYKLKDICILTRKRKHGILLANFLMQQSIPIISSETLLLGSSPKVKFLVCLLQLSTQPQDLETHYNVLYHLATDKNSRHDFIQKHLGNLDFLLQNEYQFSLEFLKQSSVYDGMEYAIKQFRLVDGSDAYITYFMDVVLEVEQKEGTGVQAFLTYWEKKKDKLSIIAPENVDAAQIMTVHKSKGLEFPIVIFPYANSNIYEEIEPKLWLSVAKNEFNGFEEVLISKKQEVVHYSKQAEILYDEEQHKLELDAFNLLYVALTRAIKALYVITEKDLTAKGEHKTDYYSGLFIHYLKERGYWEPSTMTYSFGILNINSEEETTTGQQKDIPYQYSHKERPSFKILTQSGILWETEREDAIYKGNLIHYIMGLIETERNIGDAFDVLVQNGDITEDEKNILQTKISQIVYHPELKTFYEEGNIIKNERDIITENGLILRPDRIVINGHRATIIDYKTGKKNITHHQQIHSYANALKTMGYLVENKVIVYIDESVTPEFI